MDQVRLLAAATYGSRSPAALQGPEVAVFYTPGCSGVPIQAGLAKLSPFLYEGQTNAEGVI
jgi:hypothetical protein